MPSLKSRIELTNKCGNECWYCYASKGDEMMSMDLYMQIINRLKSIFDTGRYNRINLGFSGGDPFQNDFIVEAGRIAKEVFKDALRNPFSTICRPSDLDIVERFYQADGVAYYSLNEDPLDEVEEKVRRLQANQANRKRIGLLFLFTAYNLQRLDAILDMIVRLKLTFRMNHLYDVDNELGEQAIIEGIDRVFTYLTRTQYPAMMLKEYPHILGIPIFSNFHRLNQTTQYCGYGQNYFHFNVRGEVSRCQCEAPVSTVDDPDLEKAIKVRLDYGECTACDAFFLCRGGCIYSNRKKRYCNVYKRVFHYLKTYQSDAVQAFLREAGIMKQGEKWAYQFCRI